MKLLLLLSSLLFLSFTNNNTEDLARYSKVFLSIKSVELIKIDDPISDAPVNLILLKAFDTKGIHLGYIREVVTSTGCNSACLPVIFTLFYDKNLIFKTLKSKVGLTKKFHAKFTKANYAQLEMIIVMNPEKFKKVIHPKEMTDAITGATLKEYKSAVIKNAAYTSLRVNLYNQHTLKFLNKLK
jgi:hypothetical protein